MPQPTPAHSSRTSSRSALSAPSRPSRPFRSSRPFPPHATSAPAHTPVLAVTADALVVADFRPRTRRPRPRRPPGPYRRLLATPGARAFTAGNLLARLPAGMFSVSAVVMIAGTRGSYALAGAVTATGLAATALVAPWTARLVDRYGQARAALPATLVAALGSLALLLCVRWNAPAWTLFAAYAATATTPNTGGMARARWAHLLKGDAGALHTANSFEQAMDELCFMLGPVLAAFLCTALFPEAGTLVAVVLLVTGMLLFTAQRSTEPPARPRPNAKAPLRTPGIPALLVVCLATGGVFGATEVVTIAFADAQGPRAAAGVVLALQAAGSCAAGLLYGALKPAGPATRRLPWCVAAMTALLTLPLLAASLSGSLPLLALTLLVAGMATAPTMVTTMTLVQQRTPRDRLNEGMTLAVTGLLGGIACGSAAGGWTVEHVSPAAAYAIPVTAAATALLLALLPPRTPRHNPRDAATRH
ncbi:MFS transporter [Streptomyces olivaceus]|uniref:MFS transporter n=1 Tax=Streptomyces olivaceus TaxID=47716 RepID=UPI001CCF39E1|nr:MFS transporter [Streptomyces olivaceus]MBZ6177130.1 MFS transporter [Streptomyces olivaceus]MBZ6183951.1 MFS transporter [Streptomyces olivaceus]